MADLKTQIDCLTSSTDVNQEKAEDSHWEMEVKMDANQMDA
jgi:hypothetical protein